MYVNKDELYQIVNEGIWYFNMKGEVGHIAHPSVDWDSIKASSYRRQMYFRLEDFNTKFFLTKEEAEKNAKSYLEDVLKYVSEDIFKKITRLKKEDSIYITHSEGKFIVKESLENFSHWDKYKRAFVVVTEYDDDYGGGFEEYDYPISEYGKTWALTEEELNEQ